MPMCGESLILIKTACSSECYSCKAIFLLCSGLTGNPKIESWFYVDVGDHIGSFHELAYE